MQVIEASPEHAAAMDQMLAGCHWSIHEARTAEEFTSTLVRFGKHIGFNTISATVVVDQPKGRPHFTTVDNTPPAFLHLYSDLARGARSPATQHCKRSSVPIAWNQSTYERAGVVTDWEEQANLGYHTGITVAIHAPRGRHLMIGVDRDQPLPRNPSELVHTMAALQLFTAFALDTALRVLTPPIVEASNNVSLTPRELECLRWTMEGKTAWELGRILGIAEQTAVRHLHNASRKLECSGKHHAVIRALRQGLIW